MIEQKKDAPGNPPFYVCTNCKWAFQALQEANEHGRRCGRDEQLLNEVLEYRKANNERSTTKRMGARTRMAQASDDSKTTRPNIKQD